MRPAWKPAARDGRNLETSRPGPEAPGLVSLAAELDETLAARFGPSAASRWSPAGGARAWASVWAVVRCGATCAPGLRYHAMLHVGTLGRFECEADDLAGLRRGAFGLVDVAVSRDAEARAAWRASLATPRGRKAGGGL